MSKFVFCGADVTFPTSFHSWSPRPTKDLEDIQYRKVDEFSSGGVIHLCTFNND
jgi:hypothetical protein